MMVIKVSINCLAMACALTDNGPSTDDSSLFVIVWEKFGGAIRVTIYGYYAGIGARLDYMNGKRGKWENECY